MKARSVWFTGVLCFLVVSAMAQQAAVSSSVPRLVSFSGVTKDPAGKPVSGQVAITFSLFAEQEGGTPLWSETQMVDADAQGKYTAFLGATNPNGLPLEVFTSGAARWLAVEPGAPAAVESSRVLLVGVPYALKAADADTLGGKPASAYLTAGAPSEQPHIETAITPTSAPGPNPPTTLSGSGTTDYVPLWTSSTTLGDSILFQTNGVMQVLGPLQLLGTGTATASTGYNSDPIDLFASAYSSSSHAAVPQHFRWQAEPVSNNTSTPSGKLNLLFASGGGLDVETGLSIGSTGVLTFAPGQTFPGTGSGTIKGVTAGTDLTGGGTSGVVTLNLDTTKVPQLKTANSFVGNQSVTGTVNATAGITTGGDLVANGGVHGAQGVYGNIGMFLGSGVTGIGPNYGVWGQETELSGGAGVYGQLIGASQTGQTGPGDAGVWGDTSAGFGVAVAGTADSASAGSFNNNSSDQPALYAENNFVPEMGLPSPEVFAAYAANGGTCIIDGYADLACTGSKSAVVPVDGATRKVALYAVEAP
ncbi:MAG: hypothetical protein JO145_01150, partial [Acidobacteriaceae bacterium]|nr:hypothetical protein [Acidobacteriaceae bacterium]